MVRSQLAGSVLHQADWTEVNLAGFVFRFHAAMMPIRSRNGIDCGYANKKRDSGYTTSARFRLLP